MKIWVKLLIVGVVIFIMGVVIAASSGGLTTKNGPAGIIMSFIGVMIFVAGILIGLLRGFNRAMNE